MAMRKDTEVNGNAPSGSDGDGRAAAGELRIDGTRPLSAGLVEQLAVLCDAVEHGSVDGAVVLEVSGAPAEHWSADLTVGLVNKWERVLRRLERLPAATIAVATGDCGGLALDALLAADYRVADPSARLVVQVAAGAVWPGMALYRLAQHSVNAAAIRRAALLGQPISVADALELHLVHELAADPAAALAAAAELARGVPGAELAIRRQLLFDASAAGFEEALGVHLAACDRLLRQAAGQRGAT
jgi:isomerase DpgB